VDAPLLLTLNGRERTVDAVGSPATLDVVLRALELRADRIAVEVNGELAPRAGWAQTEVKSGDRLEIVHFVGGG
jgi:sulfur carrier protein